MNTIEHIETPDVPVNYDGHLCVMSFTYYGHPYHIVETFNEETGLCELKIAETMIDD